MSDLVAVGAYEAAADTVPSCRRWVDGVLCLAVGAPIVDEAACSEDLAAGRSYYFPSVPAALCDARGWRVYHGEECDPIRLLPVCTEP
jgi:hypothetical protein